MIISVPDSSDCSAVVLETVLQTAQGEVVEHMAALFEAGRSLADLWAVVQGRPVSLSHEATEGYVDGFSVPIALPLTPQSRQCVSYWLHQGSFAQQSTSIDFRGVIEAFEWLDAHFFLPRYDLPDAWPFLPASLSWTCNRWEPSIAGTKVRIYSDRFHVLAPAGSASGAGIAAFVFAHGSWKFAGAISTTLAGASSSYQAEAIASILATKFAFDLLKLIELPGSPTYQLDLTMCYDSLTVGQQASGRWHAFSEPRLGHFVKDFINVLNSGSRPLSIICMSKLILGSPGTNWLTRWPTRQL